MQPNHFDEGLAKRNHFFGEDEELGEFGFGGRRQDKLDDLFNGENGAVVSGDRIISREHDVGTGAAV